MHPQNFFATPYVRTIYNHAAVKATRPQQRRIKHIRPVRCCHQNDAFVRLEAIHLDQQLVQRLLALVVSAAKTCATMPSYSVNFINEDDARGILLALLKEITNPRRAHAYEHFYEV